jgi:colanic acid biosynthesis glycosyl transferase WcaI
MLASGRPVIATCRPGTEISEIVSQCGLVVAPQDSAGLALAVSRLADDVTMRLELGRRAREFAESNFERDAVLRTLFGALERAVPGMANDIAA